MNQNRGTPSFSSRIAYRDQRSAVDWLQKAFGLMPVIVATDADGQVVYDEMAYGNGVIHIGSEWENIKSPSSLNAANTQTITVHLQGGIDEHCQRARGAGGKVIQEPADQFHGDRTYRVVDPEGHVWAFSQKLREITVEEMEAAMPGMKVWKA